MDRPWPLSGDKGFEEEIIVEVIVSNRQSDLTLASEKAKKIARSVVMLEKSNADEVGIHFVDMDEICELHGKYFADRTPTDCISIPVESNFCDLEDSASYRLLGDVFVCPKAALLYVSENGGDPYWETTLYLVHGLLHLLGYDDKEESMTTKMRAAEKRHMEHLEKQKSLLTG